MSKRRDNYDLIINLISEKMIEGDDLADGCEPERYLVIQNTGTLEEPELSPIDVKDPEDYWMPWRCREIEAWQVNVVMDLDTGKNVTPRFKRS